MPADPEATALRDAIAAAAAADDTLVAFEPHVTLLAYTDFDVEAASYAAAEAASQFRTIRAGLNWMITGPSYFERIMLPVDDNSGDLFALRHKVCRALNVDASPYRPHVSVAYGPRLPAIPDALIALRERLPLHITLDRVALVEGGGTTADRWRVVSSWAIGGES